MGGSRACSTLRVTHLRAFVDGRWHATARRAHVVTRAWVAPASARAAWKAYQPTP